MHIWISTLADSMENRTFPAPFLFPEKLLVAHL